MTDEQKKIIEKVQKMLALSEGTNSQEEAETAMRMVRSLLSKYNLSITDIDNYQKTATCTEQGCRIRTKAVPAWVKCLASLCSMAYDTECIIHKSKYGNRQTENSVILFIGVEPNTTICTNTFIMLYKALDEMAYVKYPSLYVGPRKDSWRFGFIQGLYRKIKDDKKEQEQKAAEHAQQEYALVTVQSNLIQQYIADNYNTKKSRPSTIDIKNHEAYVEGYQRGQKHNLNAQIEGR